MKRKTYVIGHRNPDTDSIVSAVAYAELKRQQGLDRCFPARAGKLTPQTEYILERFNIPAPEYIPDLVPKVGYFLSKEPVTVKESTSLWDALEIMDGEKLKILPVVDKDGCYKSVLNYNAFASNITRRINPHRKAIIPTSIPLLLKTLNAQPVVVFGGDEVVKSRILVAGSSFESFKHHLESEIPANALVLTGDREEIQRYSIENGARAVVITNGTSLSKGLRELAEKHKVTVMISPYDTSSTAFLILYSTPVATMTDTLTEAVSVNSYVRTIREKLNESPSRSLPVVDDNGIVVGIFTESDLIKEPNIDMIMVDHNELSQSVEGMESYRILEILDHHRLGNFSTKYPITFINRVVGATSTIVANMYVEKRAVLKPDIAGVLLAGILTDTLILRSATTTDIDREMAEYLAGLVDLDVEKFGQEIFESSSNLKNLSLEDILGMDSKNYTACGKKFNVSQVEVNAGVGVWEGKEGALVSLRERCEKNGLYFAALMVTDIVALNSQLLIYGEDEFLRKMAFPRLDMNLYVCRDILSRKKQLVPLLIEQMESVLGVRDQQE
ncbi:MAG: putative manganese-dependent inorganic diphosphatase [Kiritimatiellae bacterium]|jgi:manganese-dependent inorganic pyrophosphatase|nr:putative manganese-dependent inorganic diphosphatase [Kiritimatiellia bacterium]